MLEVEQAKELRQSRLFQAFSSEIEHRIESVKRAMESCPAQDLAKLQIEVQVYRKVLAIPQAVLDREAL